MDKLRTRTRILVIDDDPLHRELIRAIFEVDDYEVIQAEDAVAGLEAAIANLPQLIVTDMRMSRMTGLEFLQAVRKNPSIQHIPVIVSTAMHSSQLGMECLESGANEYMTKPINPVVFRRKCKQLLGHPLDAE